MSDFNIRDFRNAHAAQNEEQDASSGRLFWGSVIAIPIIAAVAGLGYKPLMEMRGANAAALDQAQVQTELNQRERNPGQALLADIRAGKTINLNGTANPTPQQKLRAEYARRALSADEFLTRVDAKAAGFEKPQMELLKYERATWAMTTCGHTDLRKFYTRNNEARYMRIKAPLDAAKAERQKQANLGMKRASDELDGIKTRGDAMAFVAGGGAMRHQQNTMGSMMGLMSDMQYQDITGRKQRFTKKGCLRVRTLIQSGAMNLR